MKHNILYKFEKSKSNRQHLERGWIGDSKMKFSIKNYMLYPRIEISVFTDISGLRFHGYIGNIGEISVDIFSQISIESKLFKINRNTWKNFKKW